MEGNFNIIFYSPEFGSTRKHIVEEGYEKGKSFASGDYPYALVQGKVLEQLAERRFQDWYTLIARFTKEKVDAKTEESATFEIWLEEWTKEADEIKRLYVAGFTNGYKEQVAALEK